MEAVWSLCNISRVVQIHCWLSVVILLSSRLCDSLLELLDALSNYHYLSLRVHVYLLTEEVCMCVCTGSAKARPKLTGPFAQSCVATLASAHAFAWHRISLHRFYASRHVILPSISPDIVGCPVPPIRSIRPARICPAMSEGGTYVRTTDIQSGNTRRRAIHVNIPCRLREGVPEEIIANTHPYLRGEEEGA